MLIRLVIGSLIALVAVAPSMGETPLTGIAGNDFDLSWFTIDGGGVMHSTGGVFELSGTIGQADAGVMAGGDFTISGGFWFEIPVGDCDSDGVVGSLDIRSFADCAEGPDSPFTPAECVCVDFDGDEDVDLRDFADFQAGFTGP